MGELLPGGKSSRELNAILFMAAATMTMDMFSALNSSPWTAESFGGNPDKAASCMEYVMHAVGFTAAYAIVTAAIANNAWPVYGMAISNGYMWWLYTRALHRAVARESEGWED